MKHLRTFILLTLITCIVASCADGERMRQQLADLQARNQADSLLTNDSLALSLCDYFDRHGSPNEQMLAHYLLARTYTDMGEAPQALDEFHRAAECADTTSSDCDYHLLTKVHGQSANLLLEQLMPHEMLEELQLQGYYAQKANDTLISILALEWQHMAYDMLGQSEKAKQVLQKAYENYCNLGYYEAAANCASPLCAYCVEQKDYNEARKYISFRKEILNKEEINKDDIFRYYLGIYYIGVGCLDSAEIHLKELLNSTIIPNNFEAACKGLAMLYQKEGKEDSVAKYYMLSYQTSEERFRSSNAEELRKIQGLYNYNRSQRIAHKQTLEAQRNRMGMMLFAFLAILLFFCILAYRHYKKEQMKQMESEYHHLIELQEQAKFDLIKMKDHEKKEILHQKEQEILDYQQAIDQLRSIVKADVPVEPALKDSEIYKHFVFLASHPLEKVYKKDWAVLMKTVDIYLPAFHSELYSRYHLNDIEYRLCVLIRLHFSLSEIGILLDESPQYVSKRRKTLLKCLFCQNGKPEVFDHIIKRIG